MVDIVTGADDMEKRLCSALRYSIAENLVHCRVVCSLGRRFMSTRVAPRPGYHLRTLNDKQRSADWGGTSVDPLCVFYEPSQPLTLAPTLPARGRVVQGCGWRLRREVVQLPPLRGYCQHGFPDRCKQAAAKSLSLGKYL